MRQSEHARVLLPCAKESTFFSKNARKSWHGQEGDGPNLSSYKLQLNFQLYSNLEVQQKIHLDWPAVSEAIRGRPGYIIYYKLDKYKEIRRYTQGARTLY